MNPTTSISIRSWLCVLSFALSSFLCVLLLVSPSHHWQPDRETEAPYGNDFLQEWVGGHLILSGEAKHLYDKSIFEAWQHDPRHVGCQWSKATYFQPVYPPPHYGMATIIAWIPYRYALIVWSVLLLIAMAIGSWLTARFIVEFQSFTGNAFAKNFMERWSWIAILLFPPSVYCFIMGQKGPIWFLIFAASWALLRNRRDGWAGIAFGLLSIKPTLFFLLPIVMLRYGCWRFIVGVAFSVAVVWGAAFAMLPLEVWRGFGETTLLSSSYAGIDGYHLEWSCNLLCMSYIGRGASEIALLKFLLVLPLCIYGLISVTKPKRLEVDNPNTLWRILIVTFLLSPHAYYYDMVVMLVPILWFVTSNPKRGLVYYALLVVSIIAAPTAWSMLGVPLIPIVLLGILVEHGLSTVQPFVVCDPKMVSA